MRLVTFALAALSAVCAPASHSGEGFPVKPVRLIVGNSPGGANDLLARAVGQRLNEAWGQPVIVDNRDGASGVIAMEIAARAAPDGYTLLLSNSQMPTNMLLGKVPFDIRKSYVQVVELVTQGYVAVVNPALAVSSVKELVAYAKAKPGAINFGSPGVASPAHLGIELFKVATGANMVHVPYKGNGPAMVDLMSGQIQLLFSSAVSVSPHVRSGRLKALAVTGPRRMQAMPNLPTVAESGVPGYELTNSYGFFAPARTPAAVVAAINRQCNQVIANPQFKARLEADGVDAAQPNTPADYRATVGRQIAQLEKFFATPGISKESFR
ncbi:MAG TPA: tripartite tricarboxylate transporter substrate binding protein [Burkholderiales bacterium]|nr:tripartite tricarboxylate transporter substrate binding protein [Burkholderiales bacterium]